MSRDDSILSSDYAPGLSGGAQAHLMKVLANVVETQKNMASQFSTLFDRVEEARNETRRNVTALADEIKKLEMRSNTMFEKVTTRLMEQNDSLSAAHASERAQLIVQNENMLGLLWNTLSNGASRSAPAAPSVPDVKPIVAPAAPSVPDVKPVVAPAAPSVPDVKPVVAPAAPSVPDVKPAVAPATPSVPDVKPVVAPAAPDPVAPSVPDVKPVVASAAPSAPDVKPVAAPATSTSVPVVKPVVTPAPTAPSVPAAKTVVTPAPTAPSVPAVKPVVTPAPSSAAWGDKFKMVAGEWECAECYTRCPADAVECVCCGTANPNSEKKESDKPANPFGKNATVFNPAAASGSGGSTAPKFSFGLGGGAAAAPATASPLAAPKAETKPAVSSFSFGSSTASTAAPVATTTTTAPKFSFMQAAAAATKEDEKKPTLGASTASSASSNAFGGGVAAAVTPTPSTFSFKTATSAAAPSATASPLPNFSFKTPDPSKPSIFGGSSKTLFGTSNPSTPTDTKKVEEEKKETPGSVFGSSFMSGAQSTSAGFSALSGKPSIFDQQDKVSEGQKNFSNLAKSRPFGQSVAVTATSNTSTANDEDGEEGEPEEYEPDVQFAPVIPLPDLVEVKTGEEDEKVLYNTRSKIYRFVRETKEYKERGVGDLKLLHNEATNKFRVVMRRDQVHKLCANFSVLKTSNLVKKEGTDNVRNIIVTDFAENDAGEMETLCLKFKNAEVANDFQKAFEDAQARLV